MLLHNQKTKLAHLCVLSCIQAPIALITSHVGVTFGVYTVHALMVMSVRLSGLL